MVRGAGIYMLINTIFNLQAVFFGHVNEKKETETFLRTWIDFKGKGSRGKKREKM